MRMFRHLLVGYLLKYCLGSPTSLLTDQWKIGLHYFPWLVCTTSCQLSIEKARKSSLPRQLRFKGYHPRMLHYSNMFRGPSIKVDMFGVMWFVQIPRSLLQIIGDGKRQIVGFINHSGPPLKRHPRHATN